MSLGELYQIFQMLVGGGLGALAIGFLYRQKKISQERDRLRADAKREKLKNDEKAIVDKMYSMPIDKLVNSAPVIRPSDDPEGND